MNKVRKTWLLHQTLTAALFFVFFLYAFFSTVPSASNLQSTGFFPVSPENTSQESSNSSPVNVYVYRLPRKFTYGVVEHFWRARGFTDSETRSYPSHQHSAEWYLFLDLTTRHELHWAGSPVIPVSHPEEAELFYVPFFSSLSSIVNKNQLPSSSDWIKQYDDGKAQEELVAWLEKQEYWTRSEGRDHVLVCQNPKALNRVRDRVKNAVLLVSSFGRVRRDQGSPSKDVVVPCSHRISTYDGDIGVENRKRLLLFAGNPYHHEGAKIRDFLFQALENEEDAIIEHGAALQENQVLASERMRSSKFCLDSLPPPGSSPASCRLFDAIFSMCIPVIVSGSSIELPFEDVIDYRKIALFVQSTSAVKPAFLVAMLRNVTTDRILEYQRELKLVKRYFDYKDPNGAVREIWHQVLQKLSLIKLMMINHDNGLEIRCM